jgi:hypothetical protein
MRRVPFLLIVFARRESPTRRRKPDEKAPTKSFTPTSKSIQVQHVGGGNSQLINNLPLPMTIVIDSSDYLH